MSGAQSSYYNLCEAWRFPVLLISDRQLSLAYLEGVIFVEIVCAKSQLSFNNSQGPKPLKNVTTRAPTKLPSGHSVWTSPFSICKTGSPVIIEEGWSHLGIGAQCGKNRLRTQLVPWKPCFILFSDVPSGPSLPLTLLSVCQLPLSSCNFQYHFHTLLLPSGNSLHTSGCRVSFCAFCKLQ